MIMHYFSAILKASKVLNLALVVGIVRFETFDQLLMIFMKLRVYLSTK